jgi:hypothetical protein
MTLTWPLSWTRKLPPACDCCDRPLTPETGRRATPDGLGWFCARCYAEHTRPVGKASQANHGELAYNG